MTDEPKYQFQYGPEDRKRFTQEEAIQDMEEFMEFLRKNDKLMEPTWFLYLQDDQWHCIAGSVVDEHGTGERIQEFKVEE